MIDLHAHTSESDGSLSPADLIELASAIGLEALAITDHDTFTGFDHALPLAGRLGLELLCGIEISVKYQGRTVHLLAYFPNGDPGALFRNWVLGLQHSRRSRNQRLLEKLKAHGIDIPEDELEQRGGPLPGRPHIAAMMVKKGYVASPQQAFDEYLDESAACFVQRDEPSFEEAVKRIAEAEGISSLAHPCRVTRDPVQLEQLFRRMRQMGLSAIEAYHSDHSLEEVSRYVALAADLGYSVTGGSDFHGAAKPDIQLGTGRNGNLCVPHSVLDRLRPLN